MDVRSFALDYAGRGWPVLPLHSYIDGCCTCGDETCRSPAKHPITPNGVKDASADPDVIRRWMDETHDMANVGIKTGDGGSWWMLMQKTAVWNRSRRGRGSSASSPQRRASRPGAAGSINTSLIPKA